MNRPSRSPPPVLEYTSESRRMATQSRWGKASLFCGLLVVALMILAAVVFRMFGSPTAVGATAAYKTTLLITLAGPMFLAAGVGLITGVIGAVQHSHLRSLAVVGACLNLFLAMLLSSIA